MEVHSSLSHHATKAFACETWQNFILETSFSPPLLDMTTIAQ